MTEEQLAAMAAKALRAYDYRAGRPCESAEEAHRDGLRAAADVLAAGARELAARRQRRLWWRRWLGR